MARFPGILAEVDDGRAAWQEFVSGVARTFEGSEAGLAAIGGALIVLVIIGLDFRVSKWLTRSRSTQRPDTD